MGTGSSGLGHSPTTAGSMQTTARGEGSLGHRQRRPNSGPARPLFHGQIWIWLLGSRADNPFCESKRLKTVEKRVHVFVFGGNHLIRTVIPESGSWLGHPTRSALGWILVNMTGCVLSMHKAQNIAPEWSGAAGLSSTKSPDSFRGHLPSATYGHSFAFAGKF